MKQTSTKKQANSGSNISGKVPPQAVDYEEVVLGSLMLEPQCFNRINHIINTESFYKEAHQKIFSAISNLHYDGTPADIITVTQRLKEKGDLDIVGGAYYIAQLTDRVASAANIEYHCRILAQKQIARSLIRLSHEVSIQCFDESIDVFDVLSGLESELLKIKNFEESKVFTIRDAINEMKRQIDYNITNTEKMTGVPTGFTEYDRFTAGLHGSDLIILAAEPAQGKTAFALNLVNNACVMFGRKAAVYSLEMSKMQLAGRLVSQATRISSKHLLYGKMKQEELNLLNEKIGKLVDSHIYIDDNATTRIDSIISSIKNLKLKYNIDFAVIDYLQLISYDQKGKTKEQEVGDMSRRFKLCAKELDIPIIVLSQLTKQQAGSPYPTLSRLRDSGQIEANADQVWFLYRPEMYGYSNYNEGWQSQWPVENTGELNLAKGRNVGVSKFVLSFEKEFTLFSDFDDRKGFVMPSDIKEPEDSESTVKYAIQPNRDFENQKSEVATQATPEIGFTEDKGEVPF